MRKKINYHHGDLRETFLKAARELLERDGLVGLSVRKCAEFVGVSHTAPKNHFGNIEGLLTALVIRGYQELRENMVAGIGTNSSHNEKREAALEGYTRFAQSNPALYELMFCRDRYANDHPELSPEIKNCFTILADVAKDLGWHSGLAEDCAAKAQLALWSFVHGYSQLVTAGRVKKESMQALSILDILPKIKNTK